MPSEPLPLDFTELVDQLRRANTNTERRCRDCKAETPDELTWVCGACDEKRRAEDAVKEGEAKARKLAAAQQRARETVPKHYRWARFGMPELAARLRRPDVDKARSLAAVDQIVFVGGAGAGKTSLACALLDVYIAERSPDAMFVAAYDLARARAGHKLGDGDDAPLVEAAQRAGLLLLDDLGQERRTELSAVPDVLLERHAEARPTWVTTGFSRDEIAQRYGDGLARRLFEEGWRVVRLQKTKEQRP